MATDDVLAIALQDVSVLAFPVARKISGDPLKNGTTNAALSQPLRVATALLRSIKVGRNVDRKHDEDGPEAQKSCHWPHEECQEEEADGFVDPSGHRLTVGATEGCLLFKVRREEVETGKEEDPDSPEDVGIHFFCIFFYFKLNLLFLIINTM